MPILSSAPLLKKNLDPPLLLDSLYTVLDSTRELNTINYILIEQQLN